jgi:hypothetical protein
MMPAEDSCPGGAGSDSGSTKWVPPASAYGKGARPAGGASAPKLSAAARTQLSAANMVHDWVSEAPTVRVSGPAGYVMVAILQFVAAFLFVFGPRVVQDSGGGRLTVAVMYLAVILGTVSRREWFLYGAQFRPGAAVVDVWARRMDLPTGVASLVGMAAGSLLAAWSVDLLLYGSGGLRLPTPASPIGSRDVLAAWVVEIVCSAVMTAVRLANYNKTLEENVPEALTTAAAVLVAIPISGASLNPFFAVSAYLVAGNSTHPELYILAPVIGWAAGLFLSASVLWFRETYGGLLPGEDYEVDQDGHYTSIKMEGRGGVA